MQSKKFPWFYPSPGSAVEGCLTVHIIDEDRLPLSTSVQWRDTRLGEIGSAADVESTRYLL